MTLIRSIVVTGGSGYVGWNLLNRLQADRIPYINIDIKEPDPPQTPETTSETPPKVSSTFIKADIRDLSNMLKATKNAGQIIHLAALPDVQSSIKDPIPSHETNLTGTLNMLEVARQNDIQTFIFISSFAAKDIQSPYGLQKRVAEEYCELYSRLYGIQAVVLRLSNLYGGPNYVQNKESVMAVFTKRLAANQPLTVFGGEQTRDFVHIDDVVQAIIMAPKCPTQNEIYEICSGKATSIKTLAKLFQEHDPRIEIRYEAYRKGEVMHSVGDPASAIREIGYKPEMGLEAGIEALLKYIFNL